MKLNKHLYIGLIAVISLLMLQTSCTKKKLELDVEQDICKRFKIERPTYNLLDDPCDTTTTASFEIIFYYNGSAECLNKVINKPIFYEADNGEMSNVTFPATMEKGSYTVNEDSSKVTYIMDVEFASLAEAQKFNHMVLDFNTVNELEDESNTLQIRINTSCSTVDPSTYTTNSNTVTIPPSQTTFTIKLWDNAAEDGDIVSVYLNGEWIIENHTLTNAGTFFDFSTSKLNAGSNDLVVFALNQGSSGPNTVSISVNGTEIDGFSPDLLTGEAVEINF